MRNMWAVQDTNLEFGCYNNCDRYSFCSKIHVILTLILGFKKLTFASSKEGLAEGAPCHCVILGHADKMLGAAEKVQLCFRLFWDPFTVYESGSKRGPNDK